MTQMTILTILMMKFIYQQHPRPKIFLQLGPSDHFYYDHAQRLFEEPLFQQAHPPSINHISMSARFGLECLTLLKATKVITRTETPNTVQQLRPCIRTTQDVRQCTPQAWFATRII